MKWPAWFTQSVRGRARIHVHDCLTLGPIPNSAPLPGVVLKSAQKCDSFENDFGFDPLASPDISPSLVIIHFLAELLLWVPGSGQGSHTVPHASLALWDAPWKRGSLVKKSGDSVLLPTL